MTALLLAAAVLACRGRPVERPVTTSAAAAGPHGVQVPGGSCEVRVLEVIGHPTARFSASFLFLVVTAPDPIGEACWPAGERILTVLYEPWDVLDLLGAKRASADESGPFTITETRVLRLQQDGTLWKLTNPDGRAASFPGGLLPVPR